MAIVLRASVPLPPSINHYYTSSHHRTKEARTFRDLVWAQSIAERWPRLGNARLQMHVILPFPTAAGDIDNRSKGLLDSLQAPRRNYERSACLFENDSQVDLMLLERGSTCPEGHAEIIVGHRVSHDVTLGW